MIDVRVSEVPKEVTPEPPKAPEPPKSKEVARQRQTEEVGQIASTILQRRGRGLTEMAEEQRREAYTKDPAAQDIHSLYLINHEAPTDYRKKGKPLGEDLGRDGRPFKVIVKGVSEELDYVKSFDGRNFLCRTKLVPGKGAEDILVPKEEYFRGQLLAVGESILASTQLSEAEKTVLKVDIDLRKGEDFYKGRGSESIDEIIKKAADDAGVLTTDDMRTFIELKLDKMQRPIIEEGQIVHEAQLTPPQAEQMRQELFAQLEGKNLADYRTIAVILGKLGYGGGQIIEGGPLDKYFSRMNEGEVNVGEAYRIREAIRAADLKRALNIETGEEYFDVDGFINTQIQEVEREIAESENDPEKKREVPALKRLLVNLLAGKEGQGEAGAFVKNATAMRALLNVKGLGEVEGLEEAMKSVVGKLDKAAKAIEDYLTVSEKLTPQELVHFKQLVQGGAGVSAVEELFTKGKLKEDKNLMKLFFGREMSQEELLALVAGTELTEEQKKLVSQGTMGILLMFLIMGLNAAFKDLTGQR